YRQLKIEGLGSPADHHRERGERSAVVFLPEGVEGVIVGDSDVAEGEETVTDTDAGRRRRTAGADSRDGESAAVRRRRDSEAWLTAGAGAALPHGPAAAGIR